MAIAVVFTLDLVVAALELSEPLLVRFIIDRVLLNGSLARPAQYARLNVAGALFLGVIVLANVTRGVKNYRARSLDTQVMLSIRRSLFDHVLHLPLTDLGDMRAGGILARLTGDVDSTTGLLQMAVISPAVSTVHVICALTVMAALNWRLTMIAMIIVPAGVVTSFVLARRVRPIYRSARRDVEEIDGRFGEAFAGIRVVRAFSRQTRELFEYMRGRHTAVRKELFAYRRELVLWTSWGVIVSAVNVAIVWFGGRMVLTQRTSIGDLMVFQWYALLLLNPIWNIVNDFSELQRCWASMERVLDVLAKQRERTDTPDARDAPAVVHEIAFEHVEFEYQPGRPIVRDFSLIVPRGSVIALVGRSGAGKTTVTDLVARFHDPTRGRILLNGADIRRFRVRTYRHLFAVVPQDVFLFDGSARANIAYACDDATDAEIEEAARRANAHEFVVRLADGYDTPIGDRGAKLSTGQRQRLAIARAILAAPEILILDEATSNLDTHSEALIQDALEMLFSGRTTFVIAHRMATIRRATLIVLMDDGRIVEQGTHATLMAARSRYYEMVVHQMRCSGWNEIALTP